MTKKKLVDFCTRCRKETEYTLQKRDVEITLKGEKKSFKFTLAICGECGGRMSLLGLIDKNIQEFEEQGRL